MPSDDVSLGGVGDPARGRDHEIPVVGELEDEHQLLRAGADQDVLGGPLDAVAPCVVVRDRLSQRGKALYGEIFLFVGMGPQRLDHRLWNREGRLPEPETVDLSALGLQTPTPLVDGQGRRLVEPPDVEVDVRLGFRLGVMKRADPRHDDTPSVRPAGLRPQSCRGASTLQAPPHPPVSTRQRSGRRCCARNSFVSSGTFGSSNCPCPPPRTV